MPARLARRVLAAAAANASGPYLEHGSPPA